MGGDACSWGRVLYAGAEGCKSACLALCFFVLKWCLIYLTFTWLSYLNPPLSFGYIDKHQRFTKYISFYDMFILKYVNNQLSRCIKHSLSLNVLFLQSPKQSRKISYRVTRAHYCCELCLPHVWHTACVHALHSHALYRERCTKLILTKQHSLKSDQTTATLDVNMRHGHANRTRLHTNYKRVRQKNMIFSYFKIIILIENSNQSLFWRFGGGWS